jgi:hypothetical protein
MSQQCCRLMIAEPCETLTSPDGYELTSEGNRVLYCILAGGVGKMVGLSDNDLKQLSPVVGGGPQAQTTSPPAQQQPAQVITIGIDSCWFIFSK